MTDAEKILMHITALLQECESFRIGWEGYTSPEGRAITTSVSWNAKCKDGSEICDYDVWEKADELDTLSKQKRLND